MNPCIREGGGWGGGGAGGEPNTDAQAAGPRGQATGYCAEGGDSDCRGRGRTRPGTRIRGSAGRWFGRKEAPRSASKR